MSRTEHIVKPAQAECTELAIVCCHATYIGDGSSVAEDQWLLQDFQKSNAETGKPSESETFIMHILAGLQLCQSRPSALLMFSGGRTTQSERTEAESYEAVLLHHMLGESGGGRLREAVAFDRYAREDQATDSFQNLLFSILRFHQLTAHYPESITVITHAFKERRFLELHTASLKWPRERIRVHGINPPFTLQELELTQRGEHQRAFKLFAEDPYGVHPPLSDKRKARNWSSDSTDGLAVQDMTVTALLRWTGGTTGKEFFPEKLPWELP